MKFFLKQKILNQLMVKGNKKTCEKILLKSFKLFQKTSNKNHKNLILLAIINSTPVLKMNKQTKKAKKTTIKEIPVLIINKTNRISLAIKYTLQTIKANKSGMSFNSKLAKEILLSSKNKSNSIELKNEQQKNILIKKRYLMSYKWYKNLSKNLTYKKHTLNRI